MQLTLEQKDLTQAATVVASLLKRSQTTLPVLSNLLVDAEDGNATFVGTDLESHVTVRVPAQLKGGPAKLTLPADKLSELVGLMPAGSNITMKDEGGQVSIASTANEYRLVTLPADDYPIWTPDEALSKFSVTQRQLRRLIDAVLYALPAKDHRRVLMGALIELKDMNLRMTATDGKKLSRMSVSLGEVEGDKNVKCVVSGKLLGDLRKILGDEGSVQVEIGERQAAFIVDNVEYRTNVIEGKYPDCDAVIPRDFPFVVRLNREQFKLAARRAGVVSEDRNKSIILKFADNSCEFSSMAADIGTFNGKVSVEYDNNPIEIAFNYQLMIETLDSFGHPDIRLNVKSEQSPTVLLCDAEPDHLCVLMPIKLTDLRPGGE